jgi:tetratricopeptide (TPR) repeat protein
MIICAVLAFAAGLAVTHSSGHAQRIESTVAGDPADRAATREQLFRALAAAPNEGEALACELDIWRFWLEAPDAEAAAQMNRALDRRRVYDLSGALALLDELVAAKPDWAEAWNQRATIRFGLEDFDGSLADIEEVLRLEPKHFGAMAGQAIILMRHGRFATAQSILRSAVAIHPFLAERAMIVPAPGEPQPGAPEKRT